MGLLEACSLQSFQAVPIPPEISCNRLIDYILTPLKKYKFLTKQKNTSLVALPQLMKCFSIQEFSLT